MDNGEVAKLERRGFLVEDDGAVPAIGSTGVTTQQWCPLVRGACLKAGCLFWVELFTGEQPPKRVAHCSIYWNAVQMTDIKSQFVRLNDNLERLISTLGSKEES